MLKNLFYLSQYSQGTISSRNRYKILLTNQFTFIFSYCFLNPVDISYLQFISIQTND